MGFIYKITNIVSGKCYIGETAQANPQSRWRRHIRSIKTGDGSPALRDAMKKYGVDKFKFEVLIICFDEDRQIYETEYIKKYNCQVPNGYNILAGGQYGGSRLGMKFSEESKKKISEAGKKFNRENPNHYETFREKHRAAMEKVDLSAAMRNSEKFRKAVAEGRVGGRMHKYRYIDINMDEIYALYNPHIDILNTLQERHLKVIEDTNKLFCNLNSYIISSNAEKLNLLHSEHLKVIEDTTNLANKINMIVPKKKIDKSENSRHTTNEHWDKIKQKIKDGVNAYYDTTVDSRKVNIEKHRNAMAKSKGRQIAKYDCNNNYIATYISISEGARQSGLKKSNIQQVLAGNNSTAGGYIWKYADEKNLKPLCKDIVVEKSTLM
jgi:group I intron endonuclease